MNSAVELYVVGQGMRQLPAVLVSRQGDDLRLRIQGDLEDGDAVCLQSEEASPWLWGRVVDTTEGGVLVRVQGTRRADRREFARVWGPVHVRYQTVSKDAYELAGRRWLQRGEGVSRRWVQPELFMNFSGSGLRFDGGDATVQAEDRLLIGVRVPSDEREHRLTAQVIRCAPVDGELATAVHFLEAADGAVVALVEFAERIQEQTLDLFD